VAPNSTPATTSVWAEDHTLFAKADGQVSFKSGFKRRTYVSVIPATNAAKTAAE
jgi:large subunit ribosomal protein L27